MKIDNIEGAVKVVERVSESLTGITDVATIGSFDAPREGIIRRIRVSGLNNLTSLTFSIAESDCFTAGDLDSIEVIGAYLVDEARVSVLPGSTLYVLDEVSGDLYYKLDEDSDTLSRSYGKMYYYVVTDIALPTDVEIKIDIEPIV